MTAATAIEVTTLDGCTLRGQVWPGDRTWVMLVHESGADRDLDVWRPLVPSLLAGGVTICAIDQRGHGASDGEWSSATDTGDLASFVRFARVNGAECVIVTAAGSASIAALVASDVETIDGVVCLSAVLPDTYTSSTALPRAAGTPRLFVVGTQDRESREVTKQLQAVAIGWAVTVTLPTADHGTDLLTGEWLTQIREQIAGFVRERRYVARATASGPTGEGSAQ